MKKLALLTLVVVLAGFAVERFWIAPLRPCGIYLSALNSIRQNGERQKSQLEQQLTIAEEDAPPFDETWSYLDLGDFVLPIPEPTRILRKEPDQLITVSTENMVAIIGPDTMTDTFSQLGQFAEDRLIFSDYDYNLYQSSSKFTQCEDISSYDDAEIKMKLAMAKAVTMPFEIKEALHFVKAEAALLAGPHSEGQKYSTQLLIKKDQRTSFHIMLTFKNLELQRKFHSYLPRIREKDFFKAGKPLQLELQL